MPRWSCNSPSTSREGKSLAIIRIGVDLAKNVFAVHGVDEAGGCTDAHRAARATARGAGRGAAVHRGDGSLLRRAPLGAAARRLGHTARILAPKFVAPYRMSGKQGKNDANDAVAICEAAGRPNMRFVPMKTAEQQALLTVHRVRQGLVEERTATINRLRGLLASSASCCR